MSEQDKPQDPVREREKQEKDAGWEAIPGLKPEEVKKLIELGYEPQDAAEYLENRQAGIDIRNSRK